MRTCRAIAIATTCSLSGCSLLTTWDGLTGASNTGGSSASSSTSTTTAAVTSASGSATSTTASASSTGTGGQCMSPGLYCGGDKLVGDSNTLYQCNPDGTGTVVQVCIYGCVVRPMNDDWCHCQPNASYCGGDRLEGDPNTLYRCNAGATAPTVIMKCPTACQVIANANDMCI